MGKDIKELISQMTLEEKASSCGFRPFDPGILELYYSLNDL